MKNDADLLRARLDALEHELDAVRNVIESLANERAEAAALRALSDRVSGFVVSAAVQINDLREAIGDEQSRSLVERGLPLLGALERAVHEIGDDARHTAATSSAGARLSVSRADWNQTVRGFDYQVSQHASRLVDFRRSLLEKRVAPMGPDRWRRLSALHEQHAALMKDGFSLIAGVTTVNLEVDAGVMDLARDLLSELESTSRHGHDVIAILAEGEVFLEDANAIALRLADTTVWNVPIAAHEFGHLVAQSPAMRAFLGEGHLSSGGHGLVSERHRQELFADVFATVALGPAFVLTSIMLRLDPATAYEASQGHPSAALRAHVMTRALASGTYSRRTLTARTLRATAKVWPFKPSASEATILDRFVDEGLRALDSEMLRPTVQEPRPELVELLERSTRREELEAVPEITVIDLLNAAWDCRARGPAERARVDALSAGVVEIAGRVRSDRERRYTTAPTARTAISPR